MTDIEEKFFEVFGIKPHEFDGVYYHHIEYPQITSDILLKLICILVQWEENYEYLIISKSTDDLKQEVLIDCIQGANRFKEYFIEQVQSLFTEINK